ncbi:MAG: TonB-dependent receptor plug domain-containing protein [Ignavibacteriaceae bacterium]
MKFFTSLLIIIISFSGYTQIKEFQLPDVIVTAGRTPLTFSNLTRSVVVIGADEIKTLPVTSLQELLQYTAGIDVKQRGTEGVQSDISIRGGTFEQTLVMIDGFKLSDPQTGHHSFNLPVNVDNIDRIEILKGQGSRSFGANAFSGVINFITKKQDTKKIFAQALGGQHGLFDLSLNTSYSFAGLNNHVSLSKKKSDGYRHNTGFDAVNFTYNSFLNLGNSKLNFLFGYNDKEFGANGFYASDFPNQWEQTTTKLLGAGGEFGNELFSLSPKFYWRRNDDRFLLNYENPSFYENNHQTDVFGFEIQSSVTTSFGVTAFGGEFTKDEINSNNLGNHSRENKGLFAELELLQHS